MRCLAMFNLETCNIAKISGIVSMAECNTILSAYTLYRHLEWCCTQPSIFKPVLAFRHRISVILKSKTHIILRSSSKIDLSTMAHHSPLLGKKVAMKKMTIINTFGCVLINGQCMFYKLADHS